MRKHTVVMKLNAQQRELLDRTVARGVAPDRLALIRLALKEQSARGLQAPAREPA